MTKRMTAKDYKKEYEDLQVNLGVMEKRIQLRFLTLCKRHPDVVLYRINDITQKVLDEPVLSGVFASAYRQVARLDTNAMIKFIGIIEKYLADKHPHKQIEINFAKTE